MKAEPEVDILFLNVLLDPQEHFVRPLSRPFVRRGIVWQVWRVTFSLRGGREFFLSTL